MQSVTGHMEVWNDKQAQGKSKAPVFRGLAFLNRNKSGQDKTSSSDSPGGSLVHFSDPENRAQLSDGGSKVSAMSSKPGSKTSLKAGSKTSLKAGSKSKLSTSSKHSLAGGSKTKMSTSSKARLVDHEEHSMVTINAAADQLAAEEEGRLKENSVREKFYFNCVFVSMP